MKWEVEEISSDGGVSEAKIILPSSSTTDWWEKENFTKRLRSCSYAVDRIRATLEKKMRTSSECTEDGAQMRILSAQLRKQLAGRRAVAT